MREGIFYFLDVGDHKFSSVSLNWKNHKFILIEKVFVCVQIYTLVAVGIHEMKHIADFNAEHQWRTTSKFFAEFGWENTQIVFTNFRHFQWPSILVCEDVAAIIVSNQLLRWLHTKRNDSL